VPAHSLHARPLWPMLRASCVPPVLRSRPMAYCVLLRPMTLLQCPGCCHHTAASRDCQCGLRHEWSDARGLLQSTRTASAIATASPDRPARASVVPPKMCARWHALAERIVLRMAVSLAVPMPDVSPIALGQESRRSFHNAASGRRRQCTLITVCNHRTFSLRACTSAASDGETLFAKCSQVYSAATQHARRPKLRVSAR
jgi:hypothetical protein